MILQNEIDPADQDAETKAEEAPEHHVRELRLWLRLLACTHSIEAEIRRRLRAEFDMTLARFDFLAQLERAKGGMALGTLSRRMMVTNGNVTPLAEKFEAEGIIRRTVSPTDRRVVLAELTPMGRALFRTIAAAHASWLGELLQDLTGDETETAMRVLAAIKASARRHAGSTGEG